jgi:nucleoside-diphosphate-sugar epimerase
MTTFGIVGATGVVGCAVAAELECRGEPYAVIGRSEEKLRAMFPRAEARAVELDDPRSAAQAFAGLRTVVYTVGLPYPQFRQHPVLMRKALEAARQAGVERLLVVSSVYSYGKPRTPRVSEEHPREPKAVKGKLRKEQEDLALAAEGIRTLVLRLPDFYGPGAENSLAGTILGAALRDMPAPWLGPLDAPHEFIYVPDAGPVICDLAGRDDVWGQAWNLGGAGVITPREFIQRVYEELGKRVRYRTGGRVFLRVAGLFSSLLRELYELYYLQETPVILDDSKLIARLGQVAKTPYAEGIAAMVEWARGRMAQQ